MNKLLYFLFVLNALLIVAWSGSETYMGDWKTISTYGDKATLHFDAKNLILKDTNGLVTTSIRYTEQFVNIENGIKSYVIKLIDGRIYKIIFPIKGDVTKGIFVTESEERICTICRTDYLSFKDIGDAYRLIQ